MITIRHASSKDQKFWDAYVNNHEQHTPYHLFAWKDAVKEAYQHTSCYLIAEQTLDDRKQIVGVLPLIVFLKPLSKPSLCALPFCDIGGVLANTNDIAKQLIAESKNTAKNLQAKFIEIRTSVVDVQQDKEALSANNLDEIPDKAKKVSMLMTLPEDSALLFSSFKTKLRSQIRKAEKNGLHYKIGSEKIMLDDFYHVFSHNMRALGSPVHSKQWFDSLLQHYKNNMVISIVYKDNMPVGAGIVLIAGNKAAIPWASTKAEYNRLSPNMMLYWSLLKHLSDNGITQFDFGRSSFGEGTYKFKKQWGAEPVALDWQVINLKNNIKDNEQEAEINDAGVNNLRSIVERIWRKLPIKMTVVIGPRIRKYISL
jgi:FemAB-related protein (PEP-CTERM system-associated)